MKEKINLIFSGDFVPLISENTSSIVFSDELTELLRNSDYHISNLESPLTSSANKIIKSGPHIKSSAGNIKILKQTFVNSACIANNHIFDYGETGLEETIDLCESNGIMTIGIVNRIDNKSAYLIKEIGNKKFGFLNYCEHEYSVRNNSEMGANGYDNIKAYYEVKELKRKCDYVFVVYHGGVEYYSFPRPEIKKTFRYLIDIGADAVISHHTHTISGYEIYNDKPIIYGLGNFYFPYENEPDEWFTGLLCELVIDKGISFNLHPVRQSVNFNEVRLLNGEEKNIVMNKINFINEIINNDNKLEEEWIKFTNNFKEQYVKLILNPSKLQKLFLKLGLFKNKILNNKRKIIIYNNIKCDSHRDILIKSLRNNE